MCGGWGGGRGGEREGELAVIARVVGEGALRGGRGPSDSRSCVGGAGGQSNCEGDRGRGEKGN